MKSLYSAYLLFPLLGALSTPIFAEHETPLVFESTTVKSGIDTQNYPKITELDAPIRNLVLTIAATTMDMSADLSEQGLFGDPVIMAITYGKVLETVMTDEMFITLPQHVQEYFKSALLLELGVVAEIENHDYNDPAAIIAITDKLKADKDDLIAKYPKTAPVFNDLFTLMAAVTEQYNIIELANHYRNNNIKMIYLAPELVTTEILHFTASIIRDILIREATDPTIVVDPMEAITLTGENAPSYPEFDALQKPVYQFILTLAATGMDVAADFAEEGLIDDPLIKAVAYGQVLRALLTEDTIQTLPPNYQAYFKKILQIEEETTLELASLNSEDPLLIKAIVEDRDEKRALLINEFPFASAVFNDMDLLVIALIQKYNLFNIAQAYRAQNLKTLSYTRDQKRACVLRHMSDVLLEELDKFENEQ